MPVNAPLTDVETRHLQLDILESLEAAEQYNAWIASVTRPFLGDDPVEIGSGIGVSAALWLDAGLERITLSDVDPVCLAALRDRFDWDSRVEIVRIDLESPPVGTHSAVVALNVLEHIEDDVAAISGAARLVRPGGLIVLFVPAFNFAAGRFDREIGHYRRYTTESIARAFTDAGTTLVSARYVNAPGLLAWFAAVRLLGLTPGGGPLLRAWDRFVIPAAAAWRRAGHRRSGSPCWRSGRWGPRDGRPGPSTLTILMPVFNELETVDGGDRRRAHRGAAGLRSADRDRRRRLDGRHARTPAGAGLPDNVEIHLHPRNLGKGAALRTGLEHATGDFTAILDADLEYARADLGRVLEPLLAGEATSSSAPGCGPPMPPSASGT